jgi:large subunit ribosomal protein L29
MAASDLRDLPDAELVDRLGTATEDLFNLRFQHATGQLENHSRLTQAKRDIARLNTEVRAREIAAADALAAEEVR